MSGTSNTSNSAYSTFSFKYEIPWCRVCHDWHAANQFHTRPPQGSDPRTGRRRYRPPPNQPPSSDAKLLAALRVLELQVGATREEIRVAYREKMKTVHPDVGGDLDDAKRLNAAMDELRERGLA